MHFLDQWKDPRHSEFNNEIQRMAFSPQPEEAVLPELIWTGPEPV